MKRILIVEGHAIIRKQLIQYFSGLNLTYIVEDAKTRAQAIERTAQAKYDLIVIDISQPLHNGLETLADIHQASSTPPVMIVSGSANHQLRRNYLLLGAQAYLSKEASQDEIVEAAKKLLAGEPYTAGNDRLDVGNESDNQLKQLKKLSSRELQVLLKLSSGTSTKAISHHLEVSSSTISVIKAQIMKKLEFKNDYELFQFALDAHMVPPKYLHDLPHGAAEPDYT